ncbi:MAG: hypothetical protein OXP69_10445 [Spirochaetaceae bacterium]|nr:hypothetical protein [Spirochaetaceae bacterium]
MATAPRFFDDPAESCFLFGRGFWAVEVKNGRSLRPSDLRGIRAFHHDYPEATALVLYRGGDALERDGVRCLPVDRFLRELVPGRPLPN